MQDSSAADTAMENDTIEVSALGRPLFPGMLYDCRKDSFIPGVTLWDKTSLNEDLDTHSQPRTDLKFSSSDSLSEKSNLLDISASLKASFCGGLVEVGGSAKFLRDNKSSNQQSRVTMFYSETSRFEQLTMTQLSKITYPQVFDQKTATHVVTAVLYGAQAIMVFDRTFSQEENKQEIEGKLNVMVKKIPQFSIEGEGAVKMTDGEKEMAENISCTFHGDFYLEQNPTTYKEAIHLYKTLPTLLKENPKNAVPLKVWLYPLHLLNEKAAQLEQEISTSLVFSIENVMEELGEVERISNDLSRNTLVNIFSDVKERLHSFKQSFSSYLLVLQKAVARVLYGIRGGEKQEKLLKDILKIHQASPFNAGKSQQWLDDVKSELCALGLYIKGSEYKDSHSLKNTLLDPDIDAVVCLTFTSLKYEDLYLLTLEEFLQSEQFKDLDGEKNKVSVASVKQWFNNPDVIIKMREQLSLFRSFSEANKDEKRICFVISAISDPSSPGCSIYLYEKGKLTNTQFQPVSKPPPPIVKEVLGQTVSLKLQKSPTGETLQYRVEYKQIRAHSGAEEQWLVKNTADEDFTLTGLESGKLYLIRYRIVSEVGVSEASDTVSPIPSSAQPEIVGGTGGNEVVFMNGCISTITKISIYCDCRTNLFVLFSPLFYPEEVCSLTAIEVFFNTGHVIKVGDTSRCKRTDLIFDDNSKILAATLWTSRRNTISGLEFEVVKSDGTETTLSFKDKYPGKPVNIDVKSGKCFGIAARIGALGVHALGFYFI